MASIGSLFVKLGLDIPGFQKDTKRAKRLTKQFRNEWKRDFKSMKRSVFSLQGALVGLGAGLIFKKILDATVEQEAAFRQVEQAIISTKGAAGLSAKEIAAMAQALQHVSTFGDEAILRVQSKILTFTGIAKGNFQATTESVLDMATRMQGDLNGAVVQLGKVLNAPTKNLSALTRVGIQFTDSQIKMIKGLERSGDLIGAQKIILHELQTEFGGSARAARDTFGGALQGLSNAFGDLLEGKSGLREAKGEIEKLTTLLSDPETIKQADRLVTSLITGFTKIAGAIPEITKVINWLFNNVEEKTPLQKQIDTVNRMLTAQKGIVKSIIQTGLPGPAGDLKDYQDSVAILNSELKELQERQKSLSAPPEAPAVKQVKSSIPNQIVDPKVVERQKMQLDNLLANQSAFYEQLGFMAQDHFASDLEVEQSRWDQEALKENENFQKVFEAKGITDEQKRQLEADHLQALEDMLLIHELNVADIQEKADNEEFKRLKEKHQREEALEKTLKQNKSSLFKDMFGNLAAIMNTGNRKMFEVGKAAAVANTFISTMEGAQAAYTGMVKAFPGPVGIALGVAAAGAAYVAGYARVRAITSTSFGSKGAGVASGGGVPNIGGGGNPVKPPEATRGAGISGSNFTINLSFLDKSNITADLLDNLGRELAWRIHDHIDSGVSRAVIA